MNLLMSNVSFSLSNSGRLATSPFSNFSLENSLYKLYISHAKYTLPKVLAAVQIQPGPGIANPAKETPTLRINLANISGFLFSSHRRKLFHFAGTLDSLLPRPSRRSRRVEVCFEEASAELTSGGILGVP